MANLYEGIECTVCNNQANFGGRVKPFCSRKCKRQLGNLHSAESEIALSEWAFENQPEDTHESYRESAKMNQSIIDELVAEYPKLANLKADKA